MKIKIVSTTATKHLFDKIVSPELLKYKADIINVERFSDKELAVKFTESVRGCHLYLFAETSQDENLMELMFTLNAAYLASAASVTLIIPYFGYCRQDRQETARGSFGAAFVAKMITSRELCPIVSQVVVIDLHAEQEQGFFNTPSNHIRGYVIFEDAIKACITPDTKLWAPDAGGIKRVEKYSSKLDIVIGGHINKHRDKPNQIDRMDLIGDPTGQDIILIDDIMDTAGTASKAVAKLKEGGAKSVIGVFTHPVLSGKAFKNLSNSNFDKIIISDTIPFNIDEADLYVLPPIEIISCMPVLEKVISNLINDYSVSSLND